MDAQDESSSQSRGRGLAWCAASVLLVTAAQLSLKWAMLHLPPLTPENLPALLSPAAPQLLLAAGLCAYALSMLCWFLALRRLPLNRAYPMLSLSYALVCLLAARIPDLGESLGPLKGAGVLCILCGVWLIAGAGKK